MSFRTGFSGYFRLGLFAVLLLALLNPACGNPEGYCTKNGDCTDLTQECNASTNQCEEIKCSKDSDCRSSWFCNTKDRKCQKDKPPECEADADCGANQACKENKCEDKPECEADGDCGTDQVCTDNKCVDKGCTGDSDCKENQVCTDGKCEDKKDECTTDADCTDAAKPTCKDGACIEKSGCDSNADCTDPAKPLCSGRVCVADSGKKEGETCDKTKNECKQGLTCHQPDTTKSEGACYKECQVFSPSCESGKVCQLATGSQGACVPSNSGKKEGEECDDTNLCDLNLECVTWKKKKICARLCDKAAPACDTGQECFEVKLDKHFCVSEREPCGPGRGCEEGELCISGRCNPPPSCDTIQCKDDEVCENGVCRAKKCPNEVQCPQGTGCDQSTGKCVTGGGDPPCVACATSGQACASGSECIGGLGTTAAERFCLENCDTTPCSDTKNFQCRTINLTNSTTCTTDADCGDPRFTCTNGACNRSAKLCVPTIGTCRNQCKGVNCATGEICVPTTGKCITPGKKLCDACTAHQECGGANDLCINYGNNRTHCGQDCSTQPCPTGYQCFNLQSGEKQCAPPGLMCPP